MHDVWSVLAMCCLPAAQTFHKHPFGLLQHAVCAASLANSAAWAFLTVDCRDGCTIQVHLAGLTKRHQANKTTSKLAWNCSSGWQILGLNVNRINVKPGSRNRCSSLPVCLKHLGITSDGKGPPSHVHKCHLKLGKTMFSGVLPGTAGTAVTSRTVCSAGQPLTVWWHSPCKTVEMLTVQKQWLMGAVLVSSGLSGFKFINTRKR